MLTPTKWYQKHDIPRNNFDWSSPVAPVASHAQIAELRPWEKAVIIVRMTRELCNLKYLQFGLERGPCGRWTKESRYFMQICHKQAEKAKLVNSQGGHYKCKPELFLGNNPGNTGFHRLSGWIVVFSENYKNPCCHQNCTKKEIKDHWKPYWRTRRSW